MTRDVSQKLQPHLLPGERLLWSGAPDPAIRLRTSDLLLIPFSLVWGGFALFWEWLALTGDGPRVMALFGLPFVLAGLYIMVGRFVADSWRRQRTLYGVTDRRILLVGGLPSSSVVSLQLGAVGAVSLQEHGDGRGSIQLGPSSGFSLYLADPSWPGGGKGLPPTLEFIAGARHVHELILNAQRGTS